MDSLNKKDIEVCDYCYGTGIYIDDDSNERSCPYCGVDEE